LARSQIISLKELDLLRANARAAAATVQAVEEQAGAAGASVSSAQAGVKLAQARLTAARAARDVVLLQLATTRVRAPEAGRVTRKNVEVGQLVQPGQPLMSIVGEGETWITANFKETQLDAMRVGQPVAIEVDAYPGCEAHGQVEGIASATGARFALLPPDNATGNFTKVVQRIPVRIAVTEGCGAERPLRPGMSVAVAVQVH
ncbi:MAG: HlyD family efflux transporter periplasmic adaptor subunit, partial [Gemmatimonadaceae bacterium]|nr:HlyD family efflux transporter periplasmic adaptor subunit [Gemmatimonadaceae bacterium]